MRKITPEIVENHVIPNAHDMVMDYLTEVFEGDTPDIVRHAIARELAPELFGPEPLVAVILEGGLVQGVVTDAPAMQGVSFLVIDYDTEGADDDEVTEIKCINGEGVQDAIVGYDRVGGSAIDLQAVRDSIMAHEQKLN